MTLSARNRYYQRPVHGWSPERAEQFSEPSVMTQDPCFGKRLASNRGKLESGGSHSTAGVPSNTQSVGYAHLKIGKENSLS